MENRGRKSVAKLSVATISSIDRRPPAPEYLTEDQARVWDKTVATEAADFFKTNANQQLLEDYCRHVCSTRKLSRMIDNLESADVISSDDQSTYIELMRLRDRAARSAMDTATRLRLTNQARYTTRGAANAAKRAGTEKKPWMMGE